MKDAYFIDTCDSVLVTRKNAASMAILTRSLTTCSVKLDRYRVLVLKYSVTRTRSEHNRDFKIQRRDGDENVA